MTKQQAACVRIPLAVLLLTLLCVRYTCQAQSVDIQVTALADRLADQALAYDPTLSYGTGLSAPTQGRFADRSPRGIAAFEKEERDDLETLRKLNLTKLTEAARPILAILQEKLESDLQLRVCRNELWDVDHFNGWPATMPQVAAQQSVASDKDKRDALDRWKSFPQYTETDMSNLRSGLRQGYSAPRSVIARVLRQLDELAPGDPAASPLYAPAAHSTDTGFRKSYLDLLTNSLYPAIAKYRIFLNTEYLPHARESIALGDLPNGRACYAAVLRANTTLQRSPEEVFVLGQQTVAKNLAAMKEVGRSKYGTDNIPAILAVISEKPSEHFQSAEDLLTFSRTFLKRTQEIAAAKILSPFPTQPVVVEPLSALEESSGGNSRFQQEFNPSKPAKYLIQLNQWHTESKAQAEIVAVHEGFPGHALQKAVAFNLQSRSKLSHLVENSAYDEGWARYAEYVGEEQGIYDTSDAAVLRRLWPARGMVVDPGLHVFGWSRQQAIDYILAAGRDTPEAANDYVDRIAVMPGQLTSYDSGGLEILALRHEAEIRLGSRFDLRAFNYAVLDEGSVPLPELRRHVEAWIASQSR